MREMIIFELTPVSITVDLDTSAEMLLSLQDLTMVSSLAELRGKALASASDARIPAERKALCRHRSRAIKLYALKRADGICEGCGQPAPFETVDGGPYLEVHHIHRLSDGGPDRPEAVVAIYPNCHRRAHYSHDGTFFNRHLGQIARSLEGLST